MINNWDLFILDPILLILSVVGIWYLWKKENESYKWLLFYVETILVWIVNGYLIKLGAAKLQISDDLSSPAAIALSLFGASAIFAILLKPLATWLTGKLKHRRYWMWLGLATSLFALIAITMVGGTDAGSIIALIIGSILLGVSISSQSLYFLFMNEQKYYKIFPITSAFKIGFIIVIGTFIGNYMFNITTSVQRTFETISYVIPFVLSVIFLMGALLLSFQNREIASSVSGFDISTKEKLMPFNKNILILIIISTFLFGMVYGFLQNPVIEMIIATKLKINGASNANIYANIRRYNDLFILPQLLFGYLIYKFVVRKVGFHQTMFIGLSILAILIMGLIFTKNIGYLYFVSFISGLLFFEMFYIWFGLAIMWNSRTNGIPVTGIVASSIALGIFLPNMLLTIFRFAHVGIFAQARDFDDILFMNSEKLVEYLKVLKDILTISFAVLFAIIVLYIAFLTFAIDKILVEYKNLEEIETKLISIQKKNIETKIKTRLAIN